MGVALRRAPENDGQQVGTTGNASSAASRSSCRRGRRAIPVLVTDSATSPQDRVVTVDGEVIHPFCRPDDNDG